MWVWIIIIVVVIGAIWGALSSSDDDRGSGAFAGALGAGAGCAAILFQIFLTGVSIVFVLWLFGNLFGALFR